MADFYGDFAPVRQAGAAHESVPTGYSRSDLMVFQDHVQLPNTAAADSRVFACDVPWEFIPIAHLSTLSWDDAGTGVSIDFGDANDPDALMDGTDISAAAGSASLMAIVDRANHGKKLWQLLGYASLEAAQRTGGKARLYFTTKGAAVTGAVDLSWCLAGTNA